jgi:hypothetical protein
MKPVTIYFQDLKYLMYQKLAMEQNRKAAELIRDAMDEYLERHSRKKSSLDDWKPLNLRLKPGAKDWISKDYIDEMITEHVKI